MFTIIRLIRGLLYLKRLKNLLFFFSFFFSAFGAYFAIFYEFFRVILPQKLISIFTLFGDFFLKISAPFSTMILVEFSTRILVEKVCLSWLLVEAFQLGFTTSISTSILVKNKDHFLAPGRNKSTKIHDFNFGQEPGWNLDQDSSRNKGHFWLLVETIGPGFTTSKTTRILVKYSTRKLDEFLRFEFRYLGP